uniref:ABC transporter substrate-binding protein n=1 Tax=Thermoanaerobacter thermocopriae TaxID=29350 RepID=UPI00048EED6E
MKRFLTVVLMLAIFSSVFVTACSNKSPQFQNSSASDSKDSEVTTITYWYWADNPDYSAKMQEIVREFNATNPWNIKVVAEEYPWNGGEYMNTLFTAVMGGGGPDAAAFKLTGAPLFTANNLLVKLDDYIFNWSDKDDIDNHLYEIMKDASGTDSIYVMPWNIQVLYVYYRPSMFKTAGVTVPKTYEEFLEACKKLTRDTNGDGKIDVYGFGMRGGKGGHEPWGSFIWARGGNFENLTSPEAIAGMQDFINLYKNGYVPPTAPTDGFQEILANFKAGKTAMMIHHIGSSKDMVKTFGDDVDAFVFPAGKNQWTSLGDTENVIFTNSKNKDAAFKWISYLATGKGQEEWCSFTRNIPVSKRVQKLPEFQNDKFMKVSIEGMPHAGIFPILDTTTDWINNTWPNTVQAALLGKITAKEAMEILQKGLWGTK